MPENRISNETEFVTPVEPIPETDLDVQRRHEQNQAFSEEEQPAKQENTEEQNEAAMNELKQKLSEKKTPPSETTGDKDLEEEFRRRRFANDIKNLKG